MGQSIFIAVVGLIIYYAIMWNRGKKQDAIETEAENQFQKSLVKYNNRLNELNMPHTAFKVQCTEHSAIDTIIETFSAFFWKSGDNIYFFPVIQEQWDLLWFNTARCEHTHLGWYRGDEGKENDYYTLITIPIDNIDYYYRTGEYHQETVVSGGGSSLGGAIAGGLIAGETGAIIGSRESIKSETKVNDNREVFLIYNDSEGNNRTLSFNDATYLIFQRVIPEKSFEAVTAQKVQSANQKKSIADKLRQLDVLRKEGILTEEEFESKKQSLLEQI